MERSKFDKLKQYLIDNQFSFELIHHKPIFNVVDGLNEIGITSSEGFSTLIMSADGKYIAIVRRDDNKLSFGKVKKLLKINNLTFAEKEKVLEITGCEVGYVSPYNPNLKTYIDESITEQSFIYGGTGSPEYDLKITPSDLVKITNGELINLKKE